MSHSYGFKVSNCQICKRNLSVPLHQRVSCPHHPHTEVHHHHHYTPPTSNYPPSSGNYYPPPGAYPSAPPVYPVAAHHPFSGNQWQLSYSWVDSSVGCAVPATAVRGGTDIDGQPIYVGRAHHERDLIPAKIIPGRRCCYVAYNGKEHSKTSYQILCDARAAWVPGHRGQVHPDAVEGGKTASGETLYIGRVSHSGSQTVGKIHPSHGTCYISFDGKEIGYPNYEVLISKKY